jgi:hypothetical protein
MAFRNVLMNWAGTIAALPGWVPTKVLPRVVPNKTGARAYGHIAARPRQACPDHASPFGCLPNCTAQVQPTGNSELTLIEAKSGGDIQLLE